jgi:hypothetical protein
VALVRPALNIAAARLLFVQFRIWRNLQVPRPDAFGNEKAGTKPAFFILNQILGNTV